MVEDWWWRRRQRWSHNLGRVDGRGEMLDFGLESTDGVDGYSHGLVLLGHSRCLIRALEIHGLAVATFWPVLVASRLPGTTEIARLVMLDETRDALADKWRNGQMRRTNVAMKDLGFFSEEPSASS